MRLTVIHDFSVESGGIITEFTRGMQIADQDVVAQVLKGENANHVVKVANGEPAAVKTKTGEKI